MAAANSKTALEQQPVAAVETVSAEQSAARALHKRYEGLVTVRTKAIKGKGAWYWAHLEPMLVHDADSCLPKAVKLRCSLCDAVFSASNPSRTASEHLKRGTCSSFSSSSSASKPISSLSPSSHLHHRQRRGNRKHRSAVAATAVTGAPPPPLPSRNGGLYHATPLSVVDASRFYGGELACSTPVNGGGGRLLLEQPHLMLSGGKHDLDALAMLEDSVKKLKSPKTTPSPKLTKTQIDSALDHLADWVYESCGSVSFSGLEHPKFKAFLNQVGLPVISKSEFIDSRLNAKYEEAKSEAEVKIRDASFFQIATNGWKVKRSEKNLVNFTVNFPNGTNLYKKAEFVNGKVPSDYAEEILSETITGIGESSLQKCVGIVSDRFKANALKNLGNQYPWMVNLSCQYQGFVSLIKDFNKELSMFRNAIENCLKLASFVMETTRVRSIFCKYQIQEHGYCNSLRLPLQHFEPVHNLLKDILSSARVLQLVVHDEAYKVLAMEDSMAREIAEMVGDLGFWNEIEAVQSLVKLIREMAQKIDEEKPLVGQCIPLWNDLRGKARDWCLKFRVAQEKVEKVIENRFKKNYHPAWSASFILDPLNLVRDNSGKYLPPFKFLTPEQDKDVDKLITRLVSKEEAHVVLMELMKWRTEGLDPVYARAIQMRERDPVSGKMRTANPQGSRLVWESYLTVFKILGKVAVRIIFLQATSSCGIKSNPSLLRWVNENAQGGSRAAIDRAKKLMFIAGNSKCKRGDFSSDEDKDLELLGLANGENHLLN